MLNVLILNGSPAGDNSITLYTAKYIEKHFKSCKFEVMHVGQRIKQYEKDFAPCRDALERANIIVFTYPVYTFLVPAQLHRFIELMKENEVSVAGKFATQISTSKHFYDITAHRFIEENCADLGLKYVKGLSADMDDLTTKQGRKEALEFFRFVLFSRRCGICEPSPLPQTVSVKETNATPKICVSFKAETKAKKAVIVADFGDTKEDAPLKKMIERFQAALPMQSEVVNIREFPFRAAASAVFAVQLTVSAFIKTGLMITCANTFKVLRHSFMPTR